MAPTDDERNALRETPVRETRRVATPPSRFRLDTRGNLFPDLASEDGFPVLDDRLQTSVPGLFVTSLPATRAFGAFFAFTVSVKASAEIVGAAIASH